MFYFLIQYSRVYYAAFLQRGVDSVVYLTCSRWGNNSHILKTFIWTVLLLVHNKIFCWKFGVFPAHYIDHIFFHSKDMLNLNSFTLLKSPWFCNGGSFSTGENQANFPNCIFSGNHDPAHPWNALVLLVSMSPKHHPVTDWNAGRYQTWGINAIQTVKSGLNRNLQRWRSSSISWNSSF